MKRIKYLLVTLNIFFVTIMVAQTHKAHNPIIYADVPDMSIIRVDDTYYMSSTTMHMSPGVPIMKSEDLVNWELVSYAYDILDDVDPLNLENGKYTYGRGSWASCLRYHNGTFYVSTFASTTNKTYIYSTKDIEKGPWKKISFEPSYHDHSIFFDDNGKIYVIWGAGQLRMVELKDDLSGIKEGTEIVLIENATAPSKGNVMLPAEGTQLFKVNGKYYLFNICWPRGGMRTVLIHRADKITGPYEGRVALQDKGVAQGGLIDTPEGKWFAYLFQDHGAVGRIPYLAPVKWEDGWPVLGVNGKVPETLNLPENKSLIPNIVISDEFDRKDGDNSFPLAWQWNHNPDNEFWSLSERPGYFRIITSRIDTSFYMARNTLTQRTIGPECSGSTSIDVSNLKDGDFSGLALLQKIYGLIGVKVENGRKSIVMVNTESGSHEIIESVPTSKNSIFLKAECVFNDRVDIANFYYSFDGKIWKKIGNELNMQYTLPHFMGYRFGLFNYAEKSAGGYVDFDYFKISENITKRK